MVMKNICKDNDTLWRLRRKRWKWWRWGRGFKEVFRGTFYIWSSKIGECILDGPRRTLRVLWKLRGNGSYVLGRTNRIKRHITKSPYGLRLIKCFLSLNKPSTKMSVMFFGPWSQTKTPPWVWRRGVRTFPFSSVVYVFSVPFSSSFSLSPLCYLRKIGGWEWP